MPIPATPDDAAGGGRQVAERVHPSVDSAIVLLYVYR